MKKHLLVVFLIAIAGAATASAQSFSSPANEKRREAARRPPPQTSMRPAVGAFPRAARGNPIQMLNPRAPSKYYGSVDETVTYDPYNPSRITGIILFGLRW